MENLSFFEYSLVYNVISFTLACMMAATFFFWLNLGSISIAYRPAIVITGIVTFIASYHYLQIFLSFLSAYDVIGEDVIPTGKIFNVAYRYVDWLLTVPLLLIELILVMKLSQKETISKATKLGSAAALMIILGYPGEVSFNMGTRFIWWIFSMIPFIYIVHSLVSGLKHSISTQAAGVRKIIKLACWVIIISWLFYPLVYLFPILGLDSAYVFVEIGYSIADIVSKAVFGVLIYVIARKKSHIENEQ